MNEREQLIKQIVLTEIGNEESLVALETATVPEEIDWLKGELVRDKVIVDTWVKNYNITQDEILAVREQVIKDEQSRIGADMQIVLDGIFSRLKGGGDYTETFAQKEKDEALKNAEQRNLATERLLTKPYTWLQ